MTRLMPFLLVAAGSCAGGLARYVVNWLLGAPEAGRFPLATFVINVAGSFVLGVLGGFLVSRGGPEAEVLRLAVGVGFCGSFTTFSTFELETHGLLGARAWAMAAGYVATSVLAGLAALRLGIAIGGGGS
jgi:CrcB protein